MWSFVGSVGLAFEIQSLKAPTYLEERVDAFVTSYREKLVGLSAEEFGKRKAALVMKLLEKPKNLNEESSRFWYHIEQGYEDFAQSASLIRSSPGFMLIFVLRCRGDGCKHHTGVTT